MRFGAQISFAATLALAMALAACRTTTDSAMGSESAFSETELRFKGGGGVELEGTLLGPSRAGEKVPAVLLLPGSGPTDRDGNQPTLQTDLLKSLAEELSARGIASFRFDKRATATAQPSWPEDLDELGPFFSWENHIEDAAAAFRAMQAASGIEASRCAVLGHSEGGLIALAMAGEAGPAALVLAGTPGRTFATVVREQLAAQLPTYFDEGEAERLLAVSDRLNAEIRESGRTRSRVPPALAGLYNPSVGVYLQRLLDLDPAPLATQFVGPVLVVNGELDSQVSAERDAGRLYEALLGRPDGDQAKVIVPRASHNFKAVSAPSDPGFTGPLVPAFVEAVVGFLEKRLKV